MRNTLCLRSVYFQCSGTDFGVRLESTEDWTVEVSVLSPTGRPKTRDLGIVRAPYIQTDRIWAWTKLIWELLLDQGLVAEEDTSGRETLQLILGQIA